MCFEPLQQITRTGRNDFGLWIVDMRIDKSRESNTVPLVGYFGSGWQVGQEILGGTHRLQPARRCHGDAVGNEPDSILSLPVRITLEPEKTRAQGTP